MNYRFYKMFQDYVHQGYARQKAILKREFDAQQMLAAQRGDPAFLILELGSGGGNLATLFPPERYIGIDLESERVEAARRDYPDYHFEVGDITGDLQPWLAQARFIFCHGVLHHLTPQDFGRVVTHVREHCRKPATFVVFEPVLASFGENPFGNLVARFDRGGHIQPSSAYDQHFKGAQLRTEEMSFMPRYPVPSKVYIAHYPAKEAEKITR